MVKISSGDALAVLRRFKRAGEQHTPRLIEQLVVTNPSPINTLAEFRFQKQRYYLLFDDSAEDDTEYLQTQLPPSVQTQTILPCENPNDAISTYALPFKGKDVYLLVEQSSKLRLDQELARRYPEHSRSTWQKYVKAGYVQVDGKTVDSPKFDITKESAIAISIPTKDTHDESSLPIIYIDDNVIVVNKPAGILTHSKGAMNTEFTVADFLRATAATRVKRIDQALSIDSTATRAVSLLVLATTKRPACSKSNLLIAPSKKRTWQSCSHTPKLQALRLTFLSHATKRHQARLKPIRQANQHRRRTM